jgi:hypothetical protein
MSVVSRRHPDELYGVPALATLPVLSACIDAFLTALDLTHPQLSALRTPRTDCEQTAVLLHMYLDACQELLCAYDELTFDGFPEDAQDDGTADDDTDDSPF